MYGEAKRCNNYPSLCSTICQYPRAIWNNKKQCMYNCIYYQISGFPATFDFLKGVPWKGIYHIIGLFTTYNFSLISCKTIKKKRTSKWDQKDKKAKSILVTSFLRRNWMVKTMWTDLLFFKSTPLLLPKREESDK